MLCNQTHTIRSVKASVLSLEEGEITEQHLTAGSQVLLEENGSYYPVTVILKSSTGAKRKEVQRERQ